MRSLWRRGFGGRRAAWRDGDVEVGVYVGWSFALGVDTEWHRAEWRVSILLGPFLLRIDGVR